jgi:hypothetical protein
MEWQGFETWLSRSNLLVLGLGLFVAMCAAAVAGGFLRRRSGKARNAEKVAETEEEGGEGYVVSAVLGLLALLIGFTFSLAVDRFETRRHLVLEEANAIGTAYLRSQLLPEPHRARMTDLLARYTENRVLLAKAAPRSAAQLDLLKTNDALVTDIWAGASAAFDSVKQLPFSNIYLNTVNEVIDLDQSRKTARAARVPSEVFGILFIYMVTTAGVLGYVLKGVRGQLAAGVLLALLTLSLMLIIDINRPVSGAITESQGPMEDLQKSLLAQSPAVFDKWRSPPPRRRGERP